MTTSSTRADRPITRRALLAAGAVGLSGGCSSIAGAAPSATDGAWADYRALFIRDGRVVDTGNKGISHSEGQGYGMLLAESFDDRQSFDALWSWTQRNLRHSRRALFSWRWNPPPHKHVTDLNDAADGDILIAWALFRGAERWGEPAYAEEARRLLADIRRYLVRPVGESLVLLPGAQGFVHPMGTVTNLSYLVFPALEAFARFEEQQEWLRLASDGRGLIERARFGAWKLPPDWLLIDKKGELKPAPGWPPRFGFDAVRIPLYLSWSRTTPPELLQPFDQFWRHAETDKVPAWVDLNSGELAPFDASRGIKAISGLIDGGSSAGDAALDAKDDYYSASLLLLAGLAARERASAG